MTDTDAPFEWKRLLDPDHVPVPEKEAPPVDCEITPSQAGAGLGAVLAVPAFLIAAQYLPSTFSDSALVISALGSPVMGGLVGAGLGIFLAGAGRKWARLRR